MTQSELRARISELENELEWERVIDKLSTDPNAIARKFEKIEGLERKIAELKKKLI